MRSQPESIQEGALWLSKYRRGRTEVQPVHTRTTRAATNLYLTYARRMGQPTQRATNYTARSNIDTAQISLHANGQRPKRASIWQRSRRRQRRGEPHTEHGLGVLGLPNRAKKITQQPHILPHTAKYLVYKPTTQKAEISMYKLIEVHYMRNDSP